MKDWINHKVTGKIFFLIQHTKIQGTDQDTFVQLYCKFLWSSKLLEGIDLSVRFLNT